MPFPACYVFTIRSLAAASNNGDTSGSRAQVLSSQRPLQNSAELIAPTLLIIYFRHGPHREHFYCVHMCFGRYLVTAAI
jgi:hypothetical protein